MILCLLNNLKGPSLLRSQNNTAHVAALLHPIPPTSLSHATGQARHPKQEGPNFVQDKEADGYDEEESAVSSSEEVSHASSNTNPLSSSYPIKSQAGYCSSSVLHLCASHISMVMLFLVIITHVTWAAAWKLSMK